MNYSSQKALIQNIVCVNSHSGRLILQSAVTQNGVQTRDDVLCLACRAAVSTATMQRQFPRIYGRDPKSANYSDLVLSYGRVFVVDRKCLRTCE
jgi:hypothetical protein